MQETADKLRLDKIMFARDLRERDWADEKEECHDYKNFFGPAWQEIEPTTPLIRNWHISLLCDELQAQAERINGGKKKEYDIIVNIPPRSLKSTIVSRLFPPYVWSRFPQQRFLTASHSKELALEHAVDSRSLILTPWYQRHWGNMFTMTGDQNVKSFYRNDHRGYRMAVSVGSSGIGKGANWEIFDDPNDPKSDESEVKRWNVINWYLKVMYSRLNNQTIDMRVVVQQRTNEQDLTGYLLANYPTAFKLFCFPGEESANVSPPEVHKHYVNGLFFPERFTREVLQDYRRNLRGEYAGQIQQTPAPEEGNMFKRNWWRFWRPRGSNLPDVKIKIGTEDFFCKTIDLPDQFEDKILSWDMSLKGGKENDPSCGDVWARTNVDYFLIDEVHGQFNDLECEIEVLAQKRKHPDTSIVLIEDAAAGVVVIRRLKTKISGVLEEKVQEKGPKKTRAKPFAAVSESGNVYLPHPFIAPWVNNWIDELCVFDRGTHDDRVDTGSQAINHFIKTKRVIPEFNGASSPFRIDWQGLSPDWKLFVTQYVDRIMRTGALVILWNSKTGMLRVIAEYLTETPNPETVMPAMQLIVRMIGAENVDRRKFQWIGNDIMFSKGHGDIAGSYMKARPEYRIYVREAKNYNELGAINTINRLLSKNQLVLHNRNVLLNQELLSWAFKNQEPDKEGYVLARALCLVTSVIHEIQPSGIPPKQKTKIYTPERTAFLEAVDRITKSGSLDNEYNLKGKYGTR